MATFTKLLQELKAIQDSIKVVIQRHNKTIMLDSSWKIKIETTLKQDYTLDVKLILLEPSGQPYVKDAILLPSEVLIQVGTAKKKAEDWLADRADLSL